MADGVRAMVKWLGNEERDFFSEFLLLEIDCWTSIEVARGAVGLSRRSASSAEPREAFCDCAEQILIRVIT